ncbi:helix-turn-helix transcriptional regulator [Nakamurella lactea]|uniref:helix-turn-helix transcriptional regulator n=1 Tax=Nakamurella lactea TaxID=459515 RepID=UPI0004224C8A|nr:WYL domain-containing protein [Nakamurella lactea]
MGSTIGWGEPDRSETSPTARALLTLELIQNRPGITADAIADRLGVTARAARRYVAILREADIPIHSVTGPAGGYRPGRGLRPPPLMFGPAEALGLVMAVLDGHHDAGDPDDPVGRALGKLLHALPEAVAAQAESVRLATAPAPDRSAVRPDPDITATLVRARSDHRLVRVDYRSESGKEWEFEAEPWAVVVRHGRWYLLCRSLTADAVRAYRVDRVRSAEALDRTFTPPAGLDPVATLEEHLGSGWEYQAEVEIDAPLERCGRLLPRTLGQLSAVDENTTRLVGSTSDPYWYAEQLTVLPVSYRIRGGNEIRHCARTVAQRMLAALDRD